MTLENCSLYSRMAPFHFSQPNSYQFHEAAVTNCHRLGGWKQHKCVLLSSGWQQSEIGVTGLRSAVSHGSSFFSGVNQCGPQLSVQLLIWLMLFSTSYSQKQFAFIIRVMFTFLRITSTLVQCPCLACRDSGQFTTHQSYSVLYGDGVVQLEGGEEQVDAV